MKLFTKRLESMQPGDVDFDVGGPRRPSWEELEDAPGVIQNASLFSVPYGDEIN